MQIDAQIKCLSNEISRRKKFLPKLVADGKMTQEKMDYEIAAMRAAFQTLTQLRGLVSPTSPGFSNQVNNHPTHHLELTEVDA